MVQGQGRTQQCKAIKDSSLKPVSHPVTKKHFEPYVF